MLCQNTTRRSTSPEDRWYRALRATGDQAPHH